MTDGEPGESGGDGSVDREVGGEATDDGEVRVWLVERDYNDKGLVTLAYATPDGDRTWRVSKSAAALSGTSVTAARTVDPESLSPVEEPDRRDRYRTEARRMAERHDPGDAV